MKLLAIFLFAISLLLLSFRLKKRKWISGISLTISIILILLCGIEILYSSFINVPAKVTRVERLHAPDPELGFKLFDTVSVRATRIALPSDTIYDTHYTIVNDTTGSGAKLFRRKGWHSPASNKEAVFLGCSFTFGEGISDESTLPFLFGKISNHSTINCGVSGYGLHQVYHAFNIKYASEDNRNRTFIYSFLPDHFLRAAGVYEWNSGGPKFELRNGNLIFAARGNSRTSKNMRRLAHYGSGFSTFSFLKDFIRKRQAEKIVRAIKEEELEVYYRMVLEMARTIESTGGKFVILFWDHQRFANKATRFTEPGHVMERLRQIMKETRTRLLPVTSLVRINETDLYIPNDGHPSAEGNRKIAESLWRILCKD